MAPRKRKIGNTGCAVRKGVIVDLLKTAIPSESSNTRNTKNSRIAKNLGNPNNKRNAKRTRCKRRKRKDYDKLPDFSCLKKLIYEQKRKDNISNLFSFNDPCIKEKIDKFNKIIERRKEYYYDTSDSKGQDEITPNVCESSAFGYTFIDKVMNFSNKEDIDDLIQHDEDEEIDEDVDAEVDEEVGADMDAGSDSDFDSDADTEYGNNRRENQYDSQSDVYHHYNEENNERGIQCFRHMDEEFIKKNMKNTNWEYENRGNKNDRKKKLPKGYVGMSNNKKKTEKMKRTNLFNKKGIIDSKKKDLILDQLKLKFDEFKIDTLTIPQRPITIIDENGIQKKKLFIFNINNSSGKKKNEKKRIQIVYDTEGDQSITQNLSAHNLSLNNLSLNNLSRNNLPAQNLSPHNLSPHNLSSHNLSPHNSLPNNPQTEMQTQRRDEGDLIELVNRISEQKESYLYFVVKNNQLLLKKNNDYFSIMMHYLCEGSPNMNLQMRYYLIMKPPNMDMLLYLILTYYKFSFIDLVEQYQNISISNIVESSFEEMILYDYYYYFFHILEISHEEFYMSLEVFNSMKFLLSKYNFFLSRMHKDSIFSKAKFVLGMGDIENVDEVFLPPSKGLPYEREKEEQEEQMEEEEDASTKVPTKAEKNVMSNLTDGETTNAEESIEELELEEKKTTNQATNQATNQTTNQTTNSCKCRYRNRRTQHLRRKNGTLQYILNTKLDFINYQQKNFFNETHWNEIENYNHLNNLDKLVYFTKDLYYKFTKKNIYHKLDEITCEQKHLDKVQMIEQCKKKLPLYKKNVKFMNFLGVYSHSFVWQVYCMHLELFCILKFKKIRPYYYPWISQMKKISVLEDSTSLDCGKVKGEKIGAENGDSNLKELLHQENDNPIKIMHEPKENSFLQEYNLRDIENEINASLNFFHNQVKDKKIENLYIPISVEINKKLIEKTKYINGTPLNEFIYSEFLSGIDLKLRVFKLKCIVLKIIKIILTFLDFHTLIILKCSRIFLKEDSLIINGGIPLGFLSPTSLRFLLYNIDETIATKSYSKTIFHYIPPEIRMALHRIGSREGNDGQSAGLSGGCENCFHLMDKSKLEKAYSYMIGKVFEESLIDTFTGDKFDYLNFDEDVKNFLLCCLKENLNDREPISKLPYHKCFSECFDLYINIYDDNINSYKNDKEKAIRLRDLNYINNFDYNIFTIPSESSSRLPSSSDSRNFNTSSQYSSSYNA
ncbi:hypothetical protein, conserved [Plasmodium gonderi]|uniref:Uncharacterized protein n=1 Tax=Plasmodium gonderi TaxID=77519 RepID=A0A1Y1JK98_PLAGO|nr:hypothetical protein, conserved [Plasmodium gonderi]GAW82946.1 hypothetical protein, conserved [Plasmodium gonderi]